NSNRLPVPQPILAITQNNKQLPKESKDISIIFASKNQSHASFQNPGLQCVSMGIAFLFWMDQCGSSHTLTFDKLDEIMIEGDQLDVVTRSLKPLPPFILVNQLPTLVVLFVDVVEIQFEPESPIY